MSAFSSPDRPLKELMAAFPCVPSSIDELREKMTSLPVTKRFDDRQIEILYSIAHSVYEQGKIEIASGMFQLLLIYRPVDSKILTALGICKKRLENFDDAINIFSLLFFLDPANLNSVQHLAECLAARGSTNEALEILNKLIKFSEEKKQFKTVNSRASILKEMINQK